MKTIDLLMPNLEYFCSKWCYKLILRKKTNIIFGVHQKDKKIRGVKTSMPFIDMGICIL